MQIYYNTGTDNMLFGIIHCEIEYKILLTIYK